MKHQLLRDRHVVLFVLRQKNLLSNPKTVQLSHMYYPYQMHVTTYYQPSIKPLPNYVVQPYFACDSFYPRSIYLGKICDVQFLIITRRKLLNCTKYITAACI